ncbi:hypothetical protein [Paenibacillus sp. FSL H3-0333]|uniref:hypothetical protein n=1 Tax=Paenibacillus sp. FSL H3-0333 TaxID=2921373 RepID=UPI0030F8D055
MAKFEQINAYIYDTMLLLIDNQNLCKLLEYPVDDPFQEADIEESDTLLYNKIFPYPKVPKVETKKSSSLCIFFDDFRIGSSNRGTKEGTIIFNIVVHNDLWRMTGTGMLRPYSILSEIDQIFNNERVMGIKKLQFDKARFLYVNENYSGYQVSYSITSVN